MPWKVLKDKKVVRHVYLHDWMVREALKHQHRKNVSLKEYAVKILKYLKLEPNGSLLVSVCDANHSMLCLLSRTCVSKFERTHRSRITASTTNSIVLLKSARLQWFDCASVRRLVGPTLAGLYSVQQQYSVLSVDELEVVDYAQTAYCAVLEPVYNLQEYKQGLMMSSLKLAARLDADDFVCL